MTHTVSRYGLLLLVGLFAMGTAAAQPTGHQHGDGKPAASQQGGPGGGMMGHHKSGMMMAGKAMGGKHKKGAMLFTPPWMKTLSDEQKLEVDRMHVQVAKVEKPLRDKMRLAQRELNVLATADKPDMKAMERAIEKVVRLQAEIMRNRYRHIVEMRAMLTSQQRLSYDMGVLDSGLKPMGGKH